MTVYRYSARALGRDYLRGGIGLALTALPVATLPTAPFVGWALGLSAAAFAAHTLRTAIRQYAVIETDDAGIAFRGPLTRRIDWADLRRMRLRYFSTRPGRSEGWMQLVLKTRAPGGVPGRGRTIRIESTVTGFKDIVSEAAKAAAAADLGLEAGTLGNMKLLGVGTEKWWQSAGPDAGFVERQRP